MRVALVADVESIDPGELAVELGGDARRQRAGAKIVLARLGLQERGQLGQRLDRRIGAHQHDEGRGAEARDRLEVGDRVVGQLVVERRIDRMGHRRREEDRKPVGPGLGRGLGGRQSVAATLVVDHDRLAPHLAQPVGDHAPGDVGRRPRRKRHDDRDPAGGPGLGLERWRGRNGRQRSGRQEMPAEHVSSNRRWRSIG
jgi:hypothetical protein